MLDLIGGIRRRFAEMPAYRTRGDWLLSMYDHLVRRFVSPKPARRSLRRIRLSSLDAPLWFRLGSSDLLVVEEIFLRGEYACLQEAAIQPPRLILDLGANSGYSVRFLQHHYPAAKIIAVEPDPENARLCELNATAGHRARNVRIIEACAGGYNRKATLLRAGGEWSFSMTNMLQNDANPVQVLTIPEILQQAEEVRTIDLLKCDIEGAERELFASGEKWLPNVRNMVIELHAGYSLADLLRDLGKTRSHFTVVHSEKDGSLVLLSQPI